MVSSGIWRVKTRCDYHAAITNPIELTDDIELPQIDSSYCREYKAKLINYPLHRHKLSHIKNTNLNDIINSNSAYLKISTTTVNNQIRKVNTFFNWLVKQGYLLNNPIRRMKIKQTVSPKSARASFDDDDIIQIFSSEIFTAHNFNHDYQFWLPLLALYSGARLEELCQLHLDDINLDVNIPYFQINDNFEGQHIKNNSSRRVIPIHPELISIGFNTFVSQKRTNGERMLFGYLVPQRQQLGHKPSQWFSKYKIKLGIHSKKKVFHSFRHTMVDHLKKIRALDYEIKSLLGHRNGSVTHDIYGSIDTPIDSVSNMLNKLSFKESTIDIKKWS